MHLWNWLLSTLFGWRPDTWAVGMAQIAPTRGGQQRNAGSTGRPGSATISAKECAHGAVPSELQPAEPTSRQVLNNRLAGRTALA